VRTLRSRCNAGSRKVLFLCPVCSHAVETWAVPEAQKEVFVGARGETVKMKFTRASR